MGFLHSIVAHRRGHLTGLQTDQRDFSSYVAHFTSYAAMRPLRAIVKEGLRPADAAELLDKADDASWDILQKICASNSLRAGSPSEKDGIPPCVCLSECTVTGLISHCERYGRFGLAFRKADVFRAGGRPCLYLAPDEYGYVAGIGRGKSPESVEGRLFALSNVYVPPRGPNKIQDYTHEREWRAFAGLDLREVPVVAFLAPSRFVAELLRLTAGIPVIPIDALVDWGA